MITITGEISTPPNSGSIFLMGRKRGSVILYKKLPTIFTKLLWVLTIPNVINQLRIACIINSHINNSITWLINITKEFIRVLLKYSI